MNNRKLPLYESIIIILSYNTRYLILCQLRARVRVCISQIWYVSILIHCIINQPYHDVKKFKYYAEADTTTVPQKRPFLIKYFLLIPIVKYEQFTLKTSKTGHFKAQYCHYQIKADILCTYDTTQLKTALKRIVLDIGATHYYINTLQLY